MVNKDPHYVRKIIELYLEYNNCTKVVTESLSQLFKIAALPVPILQRRKQRLKDISSLKP